MEHFHAIADLNMFSRLQFQGHAGVTRRRCSRNRRETPYCVSGHWQPRRVTDDTRKGASGNADSYPPHQYAAYELQVVHYQMKQQSYLCLLSCRHSPLNLLHSIISIKPRLHLRTCPTTRELTLELSSQHAQHQPIPLFLLRPIP